MLTIIAYVIVGLLGGSIAKSLMGEKGGSWFSTMALGIFGALLGGFLGGLLLNIDYYHIFSVKGLIFSVVGAVLILAIQGLVARKR